VNLWLAALTIVVSSALMIAAMLRLRRHAPEGGYFAENDRAAGIFTLLATAFSVLLGFMVFLAFSRYDDSRASAQAEGLAVLQQYETAQLFPPHARVQLSGQLICYGRSVVELEWPIMASNMNPPFNPWGIALFQTLRTIEPRTASEKSAFDAWLSLNSRREEERRTRLHGGEGRLPLPVWIVLFGSAILILLYTLFFADSREPALVQALIAGSVTAVLIATLLLLAILNRPYQQNIGGLDPVAMEHTLDIIDQLRATTGIDEPPPCDGAGRPL
jgi:hypothetical protein